MVCSRRSPLACGRRRIVGPLLLLPVALVLVLGQGAAADPTPASDFPTDTTTPPPGGPSEIAVLLDGKYALWCDNSTGFSSYLTFVVRVGKVLKISPDEIEIQKICTSNGKECSTDTREIQCDSDDGALRGEASHSLSAWSYQAMWVLFTVPPSYYERFCEWVVKDSDKARGLGLEVVEIAPVNEGDKPTECSHEDEVGERRKAGGVAAECYKGFSCSMRMDIIANVPACRVTVPGAIESVVWIIYVFVALVMIIAAVVLSKRRSYYSHMVRQQAASKNLREDLLTPSEDNDSTRDVRLNVQTTPADRKKAEDGIQGLLDTLDYALMRHRSYQRANSAKTGSGEGSVRTPSDMGSDLARPMEQASVSARAERISKSGSDPSPSGEG